MLRPDDITALRRVFALCESEAVLSVEQCRLLPPPTDSAYRMQVLHLHEAQTRLNILQEAGDVLANLDWWAIQPGAANNQ